jgi:hypothetical protein
MAHSGHGADVIVVVVVVWCRRRFLVVFHRRSTEALAYKWFSVYVPSAIIIVIFGLVLMKSLTWQPFSSFPKLVNSPKTAKIVQKHVKYISRIFTFHFDARIRR